jgi:hypothetical protein
MEGTSADRDDLRKLLRDQPPRLVIRGTADTREQYKIWGWTFERYAGQRWALWVLEPEAVDEDTMCACQSRGVNAPSTPPSSAETEAASSSPQHQQHLHTMRVADASVSNHAADSAWLYDKLADAI